MTSELNYHIVDVFTEIPLAGNPLAVVMNTCNLATERMQAIAREFNLSETTFVERRDPAVELADGVRVRIFTTQEELNFAGHPTLGTASVLKLHAPEAVRDSTVTLALNVGAVPVRFGGRRPAFGTMTQRDPEFSAQMEPAEVARLCGVPLEDLDPALVPQTVSTGTAFAIVVLRTVEALGRLQRGPGERLRAICASAEPGGSTSLPPTSTKTITVRSTGRGCSFTGARIRPQAPRQVAPSPTL